ncbi:polyprenyl synthetase family protein, partial [Streptomyces sp. NPDC014623]|uniref:polyprenyl synthetase family protein n=1 Tax=Streptomyces sp. NPDC014623 TaxID=3364875 RepID=UPI0036FF656D
GPPRRLPMAEPLQHPTPTLPPRTTITDRLRERPPPHTNYADTSRITRVQDSRSRPVKAHGCLTRLGLPLGEAFQLRDDLLDVFGSPDGACTPGLSDLQEGKRTVLLALGLRLGDPVQRERLDRVVGRLDLAEREAAEVRDILQATGARRETERMIASRYAHVLRVLDEAGFPPAADRALRGLATKATQYTS